LMSSARAVPMAFPDLNHGICVMGTAQIIAHDLRLISS
jgi:hypothetical protein